METSGIRRRISRGLVIMAVGLALLGAPVATGVVPNGGAHVAYATDTAGPNPPPDLDHLVSATPTPGH
ncbi:MAG TPA: hypothetical protein VM409_01820 [Chloroflexia bacterium]|nr:hypothetical protein [Chloroflexia bacterium]